MSKDALQHLCTSIQYFLNLEIPLAAQEGFKKISDQPESRSLMHGLTDHDLIVIK